MRDVEKDLLGLGYEVEEAAGMHSAAHSLLDVRRAEARELAVKVSLTHLLARALSLSRSVSLFFSHTRTLSLSPSGIATY